ncbi:hypothetical protein P5E69_14775 [Clostridium perfringens]|uniref:hypothetical protein n=1 Tax=Clostridium perfringens TaxID=1502 RepID=UPI002A27EE2F|nr:hypothetical protein [Clostridium perfringens]MDK0754922.1 hypothetical protein [Clostridium perfringens]MDK0755053.1 hypothetical protein [Clostridium perfringens]
MKELQVLTEKFEGQNITFRLTENTSEVMIDDVARFCGWNKVETRSGRKTESIRWKRVNEYLSELGVPTCGHGDFIPEYIMYALIGKAKNEKATKFMLWVGQVLTQLRQKGVVVLENATKEAINFEEKFGTYRIRKTFLNSTNITEDYKLFTELSKQEWKAKRLNNADRVKLSKLIVKGLEQRLNRDKSKLRASEMLAMQELLTDINKDIIKLENKKHGGLKTGQQKQITKLKQQLEDIETKYVVRDEEFVTLDCHGFSNNYMYSYIEGKCVKSNAYKNWIKYFPCNQVPDIDYWDVDYKEPIELFINYTVKKDVDIANLDKSFIDMIFNRIYGVDDNIVQAVHRQGIATVEDFADGKISFYIRNIEE